MSKPLLATLGSLMVAAGLVALLSWPGRSSRPAQGTKPPSLLVFCAAGIKPPVEAVAREYEQAFGVRVQLQYGGSGTLLSNLRVAGNGDLFLAADESYMRSAHKFGLLAENIPLARQRPVLAVAKGNPKNIRTLEDLRRADVRVGVNRQDSTRQHHWESFCLLHGSHHAMPLESASSLARRFHSGSLSLASSMAERSPLLWRFGW